MAIVTSGYIVGINSLKDKSIKIVIHTQEANGSLAGELHSINGDYVKMVISGENISQEVETEVDKVSIPAGKKKSNSQRIRERLYILWQNEPNNFDDFDDYYNNWTEQTLLSISQRINLYQIEDV